MNLALRKILLPVHLWAGLIAGLVFIVVAVSGALLVFRPTLERPFDSTRFVVAPVTARLAPKALVAIARGESRGRA